MSAQTGTSTRTTACPLDCPDACSTSVTVETGRLVAVGAATGNPFTRDFICRKVKHHARRVYAPERVLTPLVRTGPKGEGQFAPASWDAALDLVAERLGATLRDHGPRSVLPYVYNSSAGDLAASALTPLLFARLGVPAVAHTICAATAGQAWEDTFGDMLSADPLDLPNARLVILWGANPAVSNTHLLPLIAQAKQVGARLVVVDPRRTGAAARADVHLAVRPGTDVVLAYALARLLHVSGRVDHDFCAAHASGVDAFLAAAEEWTPARAADVCGVTVADLEALADDVATIHPALLRIGWGLERNRNGGSSCRAVLALWVLAGQFGRVGSGILASLSSAAPLSARRIPLAPVPEAVADEVNMNRVGAILCGEEPGAPPARLLFVQGANPAVTAPDQTTMQRGLARSDLFTVVHEQVLTDTTRFADVVLPATTHFEADDVAHSYGSYVVQPLRAVIDRVGESRTNDELAAGLALRLGLDPEEFDPDPARLAGRMATDGPVTAARVLREPAGTVQFLDTFPSFPDGRARLHDTLGELPLPRFEPPADGLPLVMISPASPKTINSIFGEFDPAPAVVTMHPDDAAARGIVHGATVRVRNERARLTLPCALDPAMRPGVCSIPKGLWCRDTSSGLTANSLVPATLSDLAGGACFNDARVEVDALSDADPLHVTELP
jgi:anaerobic selenocysteine-containing dehydrogenase